MSENKLLRTEGGFAGAFSRAFGSLSDHALEPGPAPAGRWQRVCLVLAQLLRWGRRPRQLRLRESLALGNHRFVAVVEYEQFRFLLGGTPGSLVLLARLQAAEKVPGENRPLEALKAGPEEVSEKSLGEAPR
jgi:hypothetical protein